MMYRTTVIVALSAVLLTACSQETAETAVPESVLVQVVPPGGAELRRVFTGDVVPRHASALGFRVGGKMVERLVEVGDAVRAGQVLARLDGADMGLNVSAARAAVAAAQSDLALSRAELARVQALRAQNFVSDSAVDTQRTTAEAAEARLRQARAQLELADNQKEYTTLEADADGVVTAVHADVGQVLSAGTPVVSLARDGAREVRINVPEGLVSKFEPGRPALVRMWADRDDMIKAMVRERAPAADPTTRTYELKVSVIDAPEPLPLGATATVVFDAGAQAGVRLPLRAVGERDGRAVAWVFDPGSNTVDPVPVTVARYDEAGAVVTEGVTPGMEVVVAGIHLLRPGQAVRAVPVSAPVQLDAAR
jgi:RND family efflux transporter MFP subunit